MVTLNLALAAGFAALVWWFTTGVILYLDGLARRTFRWSMAGATAALVAAAYTLRASAMDSTVVGAYLAFASAIVIWGWLEMSFLMGFVTGPRKRACPDQCIRRHFWHAAQAIIYNELATLAVAAIVATISWHAINSTALWTFIALWAMRLSAKFNLFLGVPNLGEKFLPGHLQYLKSFFRKRAINFLFPASVTGGTIVGALLWQRGLNCADAAQATRYGLVAALLALAVLEHWFMILPWPSEKLWNWGFGPVERDVAERGSIPVKAR